MALRNYYSFKDYKKSSRRKKPRGKYVKRLIAEMKYIKQRNTLMVEQDKLRFDKMIKPLADYWSSKNEGFIVNLLKDGETK